MAKENRQAVRKVAIRIVLPLSFRWTCPDCQLEYLELFYPDYPISTRVQCKKCGKVFAAEM